MPKAKVAKTVRTSLVRSTSGVRFTSTGLDVTRDLTPEEWQGLGATLLQWERGVQWWIGDWAIYGEWKYGESYRDIVAITGKDYQTVQNYKWVAAQVENSRRRESLSWSHHAEVAALPPEDQDAILEKAEREGWSVREVRAAVQNLRHELAPGPEREALPFVPSEHQELTQTIATQVARIRQIAGETQKIMAERVFGTVTQQGTISRFERAKQRPNLRTLQRIAEAYDVPITAFGLPDSPMLPAALVQQVAEEAQHALEAGDVEQAKRALDRLATALAAEDLA